MLCRVLLLILALGSCAAGSTSNYELFQLVPNQAVADFTDAIVTILKRHFVSQHATTIIIRSALSGLASYQLQSDILNDIMRRTSLHIGYKFTAPSDVPRRPYFYNLLVIDGFAAFQATLKQLNPMRNEFGGRFLIILTNHERVSRATLRRIFANLWSITIVNVVLVMTNLEESGDISIYTYFPYSVKRCEDTDPVLLHRWHAEKPLGRDVEIFPSKLLDLRGCPLWIASFEFPPFSSIVEDPATGMQRLSGFEGDMLSLIAEKLNFSIKMIVPDDQPRWGVIRNNTAISGAVKLAFDRTVNLTIGAFEMRGDTMALLKPSSSYYVTSLMFAVPPGRPYTAFEKLFRPFAASTWCAVLAFLLAGTGVIFALHFSSQSARNFTYGRNTGVPLMNMINVFLGGAISRTPARNFARWLLFMWMYYCFVLRSLYQGSLYEFLQQQKNFSHVNSLARIEAEEMTYYLYESEKTAVSGLPYILERTIIMMDIEDRFAIFEEMKESRLNAAVLVSYDFVAYYNERFYKQGIVQLADDVVLRQPICMYYPKGTCLATLFDREIESIKVSGLLGYWMHKYVGYRFFRKVQKKSNPQRWPMVLTNVHLQGCYQALICLLLVADGTFLLELASTRYRIMRNVLNFFIWSR